MIPPDRSEERRVEDRGPSDLVLNLLRFCRALRHRGVPVTPAEAVDAARALSAIDVTSQRELYLGLRAVLVGRVEDYPLYDELFTTHWRDAGAADPASTPPGLRAEGPRQALPPGRQSAAALALDRWGGAAAGDEEPVGVPVVGDQESLAEKDFSTFGAQELDEITRVATRLARRLASRPSRRWRPVRRGGRVHPRRTARQAFRTGGEVVELSHRRRKLRKTKLVLLCDVSGSMDLYSRFLLQFLFALQNRFSRVETFVFSTRLDRVTEQLRGGSYRQALHRLSREVHGWSGGTRIGESLAAFVDGWPRLVDRRTVVVVLSDGWDTGEPAVLAGALGAIHRRAGKLIWLNPLLGSPEYQPLTRGMQAALPHVDVFAPAHNLASLRGLVRHLVL